MLLSSLRVAGADVATITVAAQALGGLGPLLALAAGGLQVLAAFANDLSTAIPASVSASEKSACSAFRMVFVWTVCMQNRR